MPAAHLSPRLCTSPPQVTPGAEALADLLIKHGADPNAISDGVTPLLLACQAGSMKLIASLLEKGAQVHTAADSGVTPLMVLAASGHVRGVRLLLEAAKGPPEVTSLVIDATTENGTAALHTAARQAHSKVVSALLAAGASVSIRDLSGQSALGAAFDGLQSVAKYVEEALQEYAASQDRKLGNDMLARAAQSHVDVMELLIAQGAEPSLIDKDGNTVDGATIVATFRNLAKGVDDEDAPKDEL